MPRNRMGILITGAGSGIGRALAVEAAKTGMAVALSGRRQTALEETAALLSPDRLHLSVQADVTTPEGRNAIVSAIEASWGRLDVLVNNAGLVEGGRLEDVSDENVRQLFSTNILAPIALARTLLPLLSKASSPRVVNIGSVFGDIPHPHFAAYSASKAALQAFSSALRREWHDKGIAVTYATLRATDTDAAAAVKHLVADQRTTLDSPQRAAQRILRAIVTGRDAVAPPTPERFFIGVQRTFPQLIDWALAHR